MGGVEKDLREGLQNLKLALNDQQVRQLLDYLVGMTLVD